MGKLKISKSEKSVGELIRQLRKSSGLSQMQLAERIGITYQQVQKYEKGVNQLTLSRIRQISGALGVPASFFLDEEDFMFGEQKDMRRSSPMSEERHLLMSFRRIPNEKLKHGFLEMLEDVINISNIRKN